jgi:putative flippase GtrA
MLKRMLPGRETQVRFFRFLAVGGMAYVVQVLTIQLFLLRFGTNLAFTLSFLCSTSTHYTLNRFWALPSERRDTLQQFAEYLGTAALSSGINFSIFRLGLDAFGLDRIVSTAVAVPPSTVVVFLLLNYRVFRRGGTAATGGDGT